MDKSEEWFLKELIDHAILLTPVVGVILFAWMSKFQNLRRQFIKIIVVTTIIYLTITIAFSIYITNIYIKVVVIAFIYFTYVFCVISASWSIQSIILRILSLLVLMVPVWIGYWFYFSLHLGFAFIVGDLVRPPSHIGYHEVGLQCEHTLWGMSFTDAGYQLDLYQTWHYVPFIRRKVDRRVISDYSNDERITCSQLIDRYLKQQNAKASEAKQ